MNTTKVKFDRSKKAERLRLYHPFEDADRDNVPNLFDCQPFNPNEQGLREFLLNIPGAISSGVGTVKSKIGSLARVMSKPTSLPAIYVTSIQQQQRQPPAPVPSPPSTPSTPTQQKKKPSTPSIYSTVLAPSLTHFKIVSDIAGKGEQMYGTRIVEPVELALLGERERRIREQGEKTQQAYELMQSYEKPEWRTDEGIVLPIQVAPEVKAWQQKWSPFIKGDKFIGTEAQYIEYKKGFNKYFKRDATGTYYVRDKYLKYTPEAQKYAEAVETYEKELEKYKTLPKPSAPRQLVGGFIGGAVSIPGFIAFSTPRILGEGLVAPTAVPGKTVSYVKSMHEFAKERPAQFTGEMIAMAIAGKIGGKVGEFKSPVSLARGVESIPKGRITYRGIAYKGKPVIGLYKVMKVAGYKERIRVRAPKVTIKSPFEWRGFIKGFESPIKVVRRGKISIERPIRVSGFRFKTQPPIKKVVVTEAFRIREPQRVSFTTRYRPQNILKEFKFGRVEIRAPLKIKLPKIRVQKFKLSLQSPLKIKGGIFNIRRSRFLRTVRTPEWKSVKRGVVLGRGRRTGISIKVGESSIKIPSKGIKRRGWTSADVESVEEYLAGHRARGGEARAKRFEELEKKKQRLKEEPYETVFTSGIAPSEVYTGVVPSPGIKMPKMPRPSHLPPEMTTSGFVKGEELNIFGVKYPEHEVRMTSGFKGKPPGVRLGLTEKQWISGLTESEVSRITFRSRSKTTVEPGITELISRIMKPHVYTEESTKLLLGSTEIPKTRSISKFYTKSVLTIPEDLPLQIRPKPTARKLIQEPTYEPFTHEIIKRIVTPQRYPEYTTKHVLKIVEEPKIGDTSYKLYTKSVLTLAKDLPLQIRPKRIKPREQGVIGSSTEYYRTLLRSLKFPEIYGDITAPIKRRESIRVGAISSAKDLRIRYAGKSRAVIGEVDLTGTRRRISSSVSRQQQKIYEAFARKRGVKHIILTGEEPVKSVKLLGIEGGIKKSKSKRLWSSTEWEKRWSKEETKTGRVQEKKVGGGVLLQEAKEEAKKTQKETPEKPVSEIIAGKKEKVKREEITGTEPRGATYELERQKPRYKPSRYEPVTRKPTTRGEKMREEFKLFGLLAPRTADIWSPRKIKQGEKQGYMSKFFSHERTEGGEKIEEKQRERQRRFFALPGEYEGQRPREVLREKTKEIQGYLSGRGIPRAVPKTIVPERPRPKLLRGRSKRKRVRVRSYREPELGKFLRIAPVATPEQFLKGMTKRAPGTTKKSKSIMKLIEGAI